MENLDELRAKGARVYQLPFGVAVDWKPDEDAESQELRNQVNSILEKFKRI